MSVPVKIIIVYHSGYGHTGKIAEAIARGAAAINGASVELVTAEQAPGRWELLDGADQGLRRLLPGPCRRDRLAGAVNLALMAHAVRREDE